jgi:peptidyl-prolyl cis-trans isomerase C
MRRFVAFAALSGVLTLPACDTFGQAMTSHTDVLARAAGHELTVEQVTDLLAPAIRIPAQAEVVDALANLWVDYTLLATAAAQDSTLQNVDLDAVITPYFNQQLVFELRDRVLQVDTMLTDEQLRAAFEREQPNAEVWARHILLRMSPDASPAVRDSVIGRANQILALARGDADFAQLAAQYSEEPGAAERGGDLGYFSTGDMIPQFEDAAFRLQPGEVSDLIETPFGIHIIKVEDKRLPDFESMRDTFRQQYIQQQYAQAEETYLTQLAEGKRLEVQDGAVEVARELARKPSTNLSRRAAQRPLVRYTDGALTAGEYMILMQQRPAQQRGQVAAASDEQLGEWLQLLARDEILIEEARRQGLETPQTTRDSARAELRDQIREAARESGLLPLATREGENMNQAVQRSVMEFLEGIISGERNVVPLGAIGFSLREQYGAEVLERAIPIVVARVEERRPPGMDPSMGMPQMQPSDPQVPPQDPQLPPQDPQVPPPPGGGN